MTRGNVSLTAFLWAVIGFLVVYPLSFLVLESFKIVDTGACDFTEIHTDIKSIRMHLLCQYVVAVCE